MLAGLAAQDCEAVVIGGLAVGAYGRLIGEEVLSADIDFYTDRANMNAICGWAMRNGGVVRKRPKVRNLPVAFIEWDGKEVNVLLSTSRLPAPKQVFEDARLFHLPECPGAGVLVADPYRLLANKLQVRRPKDLPHVEVLRRFIDEEVVEAFRTGTDPRGRLLPAKKLVEVLRVRTLPDCLTERLLPLARPGADMRFLAQHAPTREWLDAVIARAAGTADEVAVREIASHRRFPRS